jgi:phosphohistidine phosphatase SixA
MSEPNFENLLVNGIRMRAGAWLAGAGVALFALFALFAVFAPLALFAPAAAHAAEPVPLAELAKPGRVLMLRHANAPGVGDPPAFRLDDCSTQRNLDAAGRAQAATLGERLAKAGVARAKVYSSQWCRCLETARLLKLGPPAELPALNSFYGRTQDRDANLAALRTFLAGLPVDGPPVVLVTHQFTIDAFTGQGTVSGGGTIFELNGSGAPRPLGPIAAN